MGEIAQPASDRIRSRLGVLGNRNYLFLWLGQSVSTFGDKFAELAIPIFIYRLTGSSFQLGLAFISEVVSALIFGMIAGTLVDRWDKRKTMIIADFLRFGLVMLVPLIIAVPASTNVKLGLLYGLIFVSACVSQFFVPAKISAIPEIVPRDKLMSANSLDQSAMKFMDFIGYGAAGLLIEHLGPSPAFIVDAFSFLVSALLILPIRMPKSENAPGEEEEPILKGITAGLLFVRRKPVLFGTVILSLLAPMSLGAISPLVLVYTDRVMQVTTTGYALIEACLGLGLAVGVILVGKYAGGIRRGRLLGYGVIGMGLSDILAFGLPLVFALGILPGGSGARLAVALPFFICGAVSNGAIFLAIRTIVQEFTPRPMIGRVYGVINVVSSSASALGAAMSGLADILGVGQVILFWTVFLFSTGLISLTFRSFREAVPES